MVLAAQGETCTAVHVYRQDHWAAGGAAAARGASGGAPGSAAGVGGTTAGSGSSSGGSEAEERLVVRDWVVGGQVRLLASWCSDWVS